MCVSYQYIIIFSTNNNKKIIPVPPQLEYVIPISSVRLQCLEL